MVLTEPFLPFFTIFYYFYLFLLIILGKNYQVNTNKPILTVNRPGL